MTTVVKFKRMPGFGDDIALPHYATEGAAAFDLRAALPHGHVHIIEPGTRDVFDTGFAVAVPQDHELQIRPRSGLALTHGVTVLNSPATIDSDFRGHLRIVLINLGSEPFSVQRGDRIAQGIVAPVTRVVVEEVDDLDSTMRGEGGFGSTGVR